MLWNIMYFICIQMTFHRFKIISMRHLKAYKENISSNVISSSSIEVKNIDQERSCNSSLLGVPFCDFFN